MSLYNFIGFIYKLGANRCVDVLPDISDKLGIENFIPVIIKVNGVVKRTNLLPSRQGGYRLFLDTEVSRAAGKDAGEFIEIEIERDDEPRDTDPPDYLKEAFEINKTAQVVYYNSTENKQRENLKYLASAKTPDTRLKRLNYIISILIQEAFKRKKK